MKCETAPIELKIVLGKLMSVHKGKNSRGGSKKIVKIFSQVIEDNPSRMKKIALKMSEPFFW